MNSDTIHTVTIFKTEQYLWKTRRFVNKLPFLAIFTTLVFVTPIFEKSWFFTILLLSTGIFICFLQFKDAYRDNIYSITFDEENRVLSVVSYKYGFKSMTTIIPFDKLWYIKGHIRNHFSKIPNALNIQMRDSYHSRPVIDFRYIDGPFFGSFSYEQFIAILNKITEVGQNYLKPSSVKE